MQTENPILDDLARAASGALSALAGVRAEIEAQFKGLMENWLKSQDLVTRAEFDAVKAMVIKAREEQEELKARLAALERTLMKDSGV